jgi:hypothetical protein
VPIFPELRPFIEECWEAAQPGQEYLITRYRDTNANLRTQLLKIIKRAGLSPWPKLFQNLRATRQTELEETFPSHVVCAWIGNSQQVAAKHYLQVTEEHFRTAATSGVPLGTPQDRSATKSATSMALQDVANTKSDTMEIAGNCMVSHGVAFKVGDTGLEPVTSAM